MYTSIDKALVALIMAIVSIANLLFGANIGIPVETVGTVVGLAAPILVWLIPNKGK